jgi:putative phosphoribosyl transferase
VVRGEDDGEGEAPTVEALEDRTDAGRRLASRLARWRSERPIVLGIPRGGVVVAAPVAAALGAELDVLIVRKIGAPGEPEYGLGAVAEGGFVALDERRAMSAGYRVEELQPVVRREQAELERRAELYRDARPRAELAGRTTIVVDDGVATGGTVEAATATARARGARRVVVALGVAPPEAVRRLRAGSEEVVVLLLPRDFAAVSQWFRRFDPVGDEEVVQLLRLARSPQAAVPPGQSG